MLQCFNPIISALRLAGLLLAFHVYKWKWEYDILKKPGFYILHLVCSLVLQDISSNILTYKALSPLQRLLSCCFERQAGSSEYCFNYSYREPLRRREYTALFIWSWVLETAYQTILRQFYQVVIWNKVVPPDTKSREQLHRFLQGHFWRCIYWVTCLACLARQWIKERGITCIYALSPRSIYLVARLAQHWMT